MLDEKMLAGMDIYTEGSLYKPSQIKKRSLGGAIFLAAIADYISTDEEGHTSAKQFLYPQTPSWQEQYDWAIALTEGVNPAWLREALDRFKGKWDEIYAQQTAVESRRALKRRSTLDRRIRRNEEQCFKPIHLNGMVVPTNPKRGLDTSFQPAREASGARNSDAAPGL
jgi:hypothetical protein